MADDLSRREQPATREEFRALVMAVLQAHEAVGVLVEAVNKKVDAVKAIVDLLVEKEGGTAQELSVIEGKVDDAREDIKRLRRELVGVIDERFPALIARLDEAGGEEKSNMSDLEAWALECFERLDEEQVPRTEREQWLKRLEDADARGEIEQGSQTHVAAQKLYIRLGTLRRLP